MAISLYCHNLNAYEAAVSMLSRTGKAAIIHPTGTGKSFIGFKLCEDNPDKRICWLSPSEYIYETQMENWQDAGGSAPANIAFFTYARLMLMEEAALAELRPDYIILDEFHRCGAEMWGAGVERLLNLYPSAPLLGLSATNIRYLDQQRDMADELFDGNIASQMTLGDAIVQGILSPPRYVMALYSYEKDLERLRRRIRSAKNKAVQDAAKECFEKLRRALANAEGMDEIFDRHMTDRSGKYLVFCSNAAHMDEMIAKVPEWFAKVDPAPHIYRAYADDPSTRKAFAAFKEDGSEHLKLMFCINMLNEGVHVDDVSGVILLRPTVSPIIYKQQIGRALSAGKKTDAVIFDIVLNVENLYSISFVQEEMRAAITYYRYLGDYKRIVNESFRLIDETRDCKRLFSELEQTLNASWELMIAEARRYYREHGDLIVPAKYKTDGGLSLGSWLNLQRNKYKGKAAGHLTDDQIAQLNELGIVWDSYHDLSWERNYLEAKAYYDCFGDLNVPFRYVAESGFPLGIWIARMRAVYADRRTGVLNGERIRKLEEIGMTWAAVSSQWEQNYREAADYFREHGDLLVPGTYVTPSGLKLGNWIAHLRMAKKGKGSQRITQDQIVRLEMIGMVWDVEEERWRAGYEAAKEYSRTYGNLFVPLTYQAPGGFDLGSWINLRRKQYKRGTLDQTKVRALERLGMRWDVHGEHWDEMYAEAKAYYESHGDLRVPRKHRTARGYDLGEWVAKMRRKRADLNENQVRALNRIGMSWRSGTGIPSVQVRG